MTSINDVRLVGKLMKAPEFLETAAKKRFAKLMVETETFMRVNGERKRIAQLHTVLCFNQFSLPMLESHARVGLRLKVLGELGYDRNGKAEIKVFQYSGEVGLMDVPGVENEDSASPAASAATTVAKPSGGLGRLPQARKAEDSAPEAPRQSFATEDDEIPF